MKNLKLIKQENFGAVQCDFYDNNGDILMTRKQIGEALEYSLPDDAIRKIHERNEERLSKFSVQVKLGGTDGKLYNTYVYTVRGIYEICRRSQQPKADVFYDWVYDVLETIRKTGSYSTQIPDFANPAIAARAWAEQYEKREIAEKTVVIQQQQIKELKPKADYVDDILRNKGLVTMTQISKDYGMSAQEMNQLLHKLGIQFKQSDQWLLYAKHQDCGYTHSKTIPFIHKDGRPDVKMNTAWTQKGRMFLYNELKNKKGLLPVIERQQSA